MRERKDSVDDAKTTKTSVSEDRWSQRGRLPDLLSRFGQNARHRGDQPAILEARSGRICTYGELDHHSRQLSDRLRRRAIGPEIPVGVLSDRRIELVVSALAIWRAGGVYVPLDPNYPRGRLDAMVGEACPRLVLTGPEQTPRSTGTPVDALPRLVVDLGVGEHVDPALEGAGDVPLRSLASAEQAAYILFTSGSAGRPKGVMICHRALAWYCDTAIGHYGLGPGDRLLQMASISFDISMTCMQVD